GSAQDFGLEWSRRLQTGPYPCRTKVRVKSQLPPDLQQRGLRPLGRGRGVEGGIADRAQENAVGLSRGVERGIGQWRQSLLERRTADDSSRQRELMAEAACDRAQHPFRRGDDFGTDAVTGQQQN